jgi:hypothetical protein
MVNKVALEQVFAQVLLFSLLVTIPPLLPTHLSSPHLVCDSSDQVAQYHSLGTKLGASSVTQQLAGFGMKAVTYIWQGQAYEIQSKIYVSEILLTARAKTG